MTVYVCVQDIKVDVLEIAVSVDPSSEESAWCADCGRLKKIACACGLSFKEKMKSISFSMEGMPNAAPIQAGDDYRTKFPNSKLSKTKPPPLRRGK